MSDSFVPMGSAFSAASGNAFTPLHFKSASASALAPQVQSNAKTNPVPDAGRNGSRPPAPASSACSQPQVTLQRDGDIVSRIRIQCSCGQVIELDCRY